MAEACFDFKETDVCHQGLVDRHGDRHGSAYHGGGAERRMRWPDLPGADRTQPHGAESPYLFRASLTATATATVAPTMGLLPMPRKPIIST